MKGEKKIAVFFQFKHFNGVAQVYCNLANGFIEAGYEVDFITRSNQAQLAERLSPKVRIVSLKTTSSDVLNLLLITLQLAWQLFQHQYRVLIAGELLGSEMALAAHLLNFRAVPLLLVEHDGSALRHCARHWSLPRQLFFKITLRMHRMANALVAVSEGVKKDFMHLTGASKDSLRVIYNPLDLADIRSRAGKTVSHRWFQQKDRPVILTVSRLSPEKDITTLIKAFSILRRKRPCRLLIVGCGDDRASLEKLVDHLQLGEDVEFFGFSSNVYSLMSASDVFCLASHSESFGMVLVESMACGCQVISTDARGGPREILENGLYGSLVPVGEPEILSQAMESVLDGKAVPKEMLFYRAEYFAISRVTREYLETIEKLTPKRKTVTA